MKTIILSDHTADRTATAATKRQSEYADALNAFNLAIRAREKHEENLRAAVTTAWHNRKVWATFVGIGKLTLGYFPAQPDLPVCRSADREETVWASGAEGERRVSTHFGGHLSDDWILISGYRNRKGEIDQVLIGPHGVFAIEIKFINGTVHCDGDRWWRDKYDRYGNLVESNLPIQDKHGRAPSRQLNESTDMLQDFLSKRVGLSRVYRAVLLSHESSKLGKINDSTVDLISTIDSLDFDRLFKCSSSRLDTESIERIIQTVQKDHDFFNKPRASRNEASTKLQVEFKDKGINKNKLDAHGEHSYPNLEVSSSGRTAEPSSIELINRQIALENTVALKNTIKWTVTIAALAFLLYIHVPWWVTLMIFAFLLF